MGHTVWLASYPKSGNTWVRAFLTALDVGGPPDLGELGGSPIASARLPFETALLLDSTILSADEIAALRPAADEVVDRQRGALHVRKVHDALHLPNGRTAVSIESTRSAVYLVRDPRAVAVSYAHHLGVTIGEAVALMRDPHSPTPSITSRSPQLPQWLSSWSGHVRSWLAAPFPIHLVRYEDLHRQPYEVLSRIVRFVDVDADDTAIRRAVDDTSFDRLQQMERSAGFGEVLANATAPFFRRGEIEAWREELPPDLERALLADHAEVMRDLGYLEPAGA